MKNVVLTPFCLESVIVFHKMKKKGVNVISFFDKNPYLHGKCYKSADGTCRIENMWKVHDCNVIICNTRYENDIKLGLLECGFSESDITLIKKRGIYSDNIDVIEKVNLESLWELWGVADGQKFIEAKKIIKLVPLVGIDNLSKYSGHYRDEIYYDNKGTHIIFNRLEIDLTAKCTLKCKKCCNMMAYFSDPKDLDVQTVKKDYSRMLENIEWTDDVLLIGGEPFLYKNLGEVIDYIYNDANTKSKVGLIRIVTNGTIIPNSDVLDVMEKCNVYVLISNYGEKSRNIDKLINKLVQRNIHYTIQNTIFWSDVEQYVEAEHASSEEDLMKKRKDGCSTLCRTVDDGKFYLCAHLKSLKLLDALPADSVNCYVDIYDNDAKEKIAGYLDKNTPLPKACTWCNGCSIEMWESLHIPAAEQTKEILKYKKFN